MKAVIVEIKNKNAAALYDDGTIARVSNQNYEIGQVVYLKRENNHRFRRKVVAMAVSVAAVVSTAGATAYAYYDPYSYVSLDVNPSIAYTVNRFDKVLQADGMNEDGKKVLSNMNLKGKDINDALRETLYEIGSEGYFPDDEQSGVVIAAYSEDEEKSGELQGSLEDGAQEELDEDGVDAEIDVMGVGRERVLEAQSLGVTPGKLNLVEKLQESEDDPDSIVLEDWLNRSVKDIMKQIKENRKEDKAAGTTDSVDEDEAAPTESPAEEDETQDLQTESQASESADTGKDKEKNNGKNASDETASPTASVSEESSSPTENANSNKDKDKQNNSASQSNDKNENNGNGNGKQE